MRATMRAVPCACLLILVIHASPSAAERLTVPRPFICMYGHHDGPGVTDAFRKIIPPFSVIEGTSTDAAFIKELRAGGKVYASHVNNPRTATTAELVAHWRTPFDNDLAGGLPGGYDAIAIDEIHPDPDGSVQSQRVCAALRQLRALYPDKLIFPALMWQLADGGPNTRYGKPDVTFADQLRALNDYTDVIMLEHYLREGNPNYPVFRALAENIESHVPGILKKTVFGLYIPQDRFVVDDSTDRGLWGHLDEQIHRIRNDPQMSAMPGLMFWVYYQSVTELTPNYCARLVNHYYIQGNTSYFGDGAATQLVGNPQFETDASGWTLAPGATGRIERFSYATEGVRDYHDQHKLASHGAHGLKMTRGRTANVASYLCADLDPDMVYTVSAFVMAGSGRANRAGLIVTRPDGTPIASKEIAGVGSGKWSRIIFNFTPASTAIRIVLTDEPAAAGAVLYWDFIELEEAFRK